MASMHDSVRFKTTVYAAIELSKKSWVVAIAHPNRDRPSIHRIAGGNLADLIGRLHKAAGEKQRIVICYEAGCEGFWLARCADKDGDPRNAGCWPCPARQCPAASRWRSAQRILRL